MFYAPAFSALVWREPSTDYYARKNTTSRSLSLVVAACDWMPSSFSLVMGPAPFFQLLIAGGLLAELVAAQVATISSKLRQCACPSSSFAFATTGPILMMWIQPASYRASLLARGKSMDYIERVMVPSNMGTVSWFILTLLLGSLLGYLLGQLVYQKLDRK